MLQITSLSVYARIALGRPVTYGAQIGSITGMCSHESTRKEERCTRWHITLGNRHDPLETNGVFSPFSSLNALDTTPEISKVNAWYATPVYAQPETNLR